MSKRIKLKNIIKEGVAGSVPSTLSTFGGIVTRKPFHTGISLANIVKEKFGDTRENQEIDTKGFLKAVTNFGSFGKNIYREHNLRDIAKKLAEMAETAKTHTLRETDDWFDKVSVNRNMKELTGLSKSFSKVATESDQLQQRLTALYEDMGNILSRYYEVDELKEDWKSYRDGEELEDDDEEMSEGDKEKYTAFFKKSLEKWNVSSPEDLSDDDKRDFFNYVDKNWDASIESD